MTEAAGIRFSLGHGGRSPLTILETAGCGAAFLDYDADGWPDIFLVGQQVAGAHPPRCALYRNERNGSFRDVSRGSGLEEPGYWMGCAAGDVDNDGLPDMLLTGYHATRLFRNLGGGRFQDVTEAARVRVPGWATSAAFFDYDRDGWLDLYVARYVRFGPADPQLCIIGSTPASGEPVRGACGPEVYDGESGLLFRNLGSPGTPRFEDVTRRAGLADAHGRGLGVAVCDYDRDGWDDFYVANDRAPGDLFRNLRGRRFDNVGVATGTAYSATGTVQGGMGVDFADYDNDGRDDLFVATYYQEPKSLYRNEGGGLFREVGRDTGLALLGLPYVSFGARFFDADNDGRLDLIVASGHVVDTQARVDPGAPYRQPLLFLRGKPGNRFVDETAPAGLGRVLSPVGRGLATADYDRDGRVDVLIVDLEGSPILLRNESPAAERSASADHGNGWIAFRLRGTRSNRQAIGARVTVEASRRKWARSVTTAGSYLSASDPVVHFGLGRLRRVDRARIAWPSGRRTEIRGLQAGQQFSVAEPTAEKPR